jgi:hypothetical protein
MSWIKSCFQIIFIIFLTVLIIDSIAFLGFKSKVQNIIPSFGISINNFDRGYPRYHFIRDNEIGFDIRPNFKTTTSTKPREYKKYAVWGNAYGCFDDEWLKKDIKGGVYLAGDSFTWGYASYEKKFGTLLQHSISKPVYACGVTHTGQKHQFEKFKRLFNLGIKPSYLIVNIVSNDINNDFFFPHSTIVDGYMIETIEQCGDMQLNNHTFRKNTYEEAENIVKTALEATPSLRSLLSEYSLTANIIANNTRKLRSKISFKAIKPSNDCRKSISGDKFRNLGIDYSQSKLSRVNRDIIFDWIAHASVNNYQIIFSFIPDKYIESINYPFIEKFIESKNAIVINFNKYIDSNKIEKSTLYYENNGHFNEFGNKEYAKFLETSINKFSLK